MYKVFVDETPIILTSYLENKNNHTIYFFKKNICAKN